MLQPNMQGNLEGSSLHIQTGVKAHNFILAITVMFFLFLATMSRVSAASTDTYVIKDLTGSGFDAPLIDGDPTDAVWDFMATHEIPGWSSPYSPGSWYKMVHDFGTAGTEGYLYILAFVLDSTNHPFETEAGDHDWLCLQVGLADSNMAGDTDSAFWQRGINTDPTYGAYEDGYFTGIGDSNSFVDGKAVSGFGSGEGTQRAGYAATSYNSTDGGWYFEAKIPLRSTDTLGQDADFTPGGSLTTSTWYFYWSYLDNTAGDGSGSHTSETRASVGSIVTFSLEPVPEFPNVMYLAVLAAVTITVFFVVIKVRRKL